MCSHSNISKFSVDKSLNNISVERGEKPKIKNFFMTPGITTENNRKIEQDIFT